MQVSNDVKSTKKTKLIVRKKNLFTQNDHSHYWIYFVLYHLTHI